MQGFLCKLRQELFDGMQDLPIRYFDTHPHGDIMSHYTNDIDTLRQLISQALPTLIQSGAIVLAVFAIMLYFSIWMTLILILGIVAMFFVTKIIGGGTAEYFMRQQRATGAMEGFAQEMMNGQKVIKVFNHEAASLEQFDRVNNELYEVSRHAHAYASILGPIMGNIGNVLYVVLALAGGVFLLAGVSNFSLSGLPFSISILVPFMNMARQFTGNVNNLSQQFNAIVMAGAGAARVFQLLDEEPEMDEAGLGRALQYDAAEHRRDRQGNASRHIPAGAGVYPDGAAAPAADGRPGRGAAAGHRIGTARLRCDQPADCDPCGLK